MQFNLITIDNDPRESSRIILPSSYKATRSKKRAEKVRKIWSLEEYLQGTRVKNEETRIA